MTQFFILLAIEIGGLFAIWFILKARIGRYLELENLLSGVREEARALILELNETADRNVSLVEDRMTALRELLGEVDRRIGVQKREIETREAEREVYARLNRRRPLVPEGGQEGQSFSSDNRVDRGLGGQSSAAAAASPPISQPSFPRPASSVPAQPFRPQQLVPTEAFPGGGESSEGGPVPETPGSRAEPITLSLGNAEAQGSRPIPEVRLSEEPLNVARSRREEALDLHRRGISAELIAARLGATVAEIELLVEIEERRQANSGGTS